MRLTEAAQRLGTSPRMLRYREALGLLPPTREPRGHRRFGEEELDYQLFFPLSQDSKSVGVRRDPECLFSGSGTGSLYARGDPASRLPCRPGAPAAMKDNDKNERSRFRRAVLYLRERLR